MSAPIDSQNDSTESQLERLNLETATAQLHKLRIEIRDLEQKRGLSDRMGRFIPLLTALISILGFLWGVYVFNDQQEKARISREQNEYRSGSEQLLQFSSNGSMTVARALSLRRDLYNLIDSLYPPKSIKNREEKERLEKSILDLMYKDCDFTQTRHVRLEMSALHDWEEYRMGLKGPKVLERYIEALRDLQFKDPDYIKSIQVAQADEDPEPLKDPYRSIIEGFICHLSLLSEEEKESAITRFGRVTGNTPLATHLRELKCATGL